MLTIHDVARCAEASPETVGRFLNRDAPAGKGARKTDKSAVEELNHVPSSAARILRSDLSGIIGLINCAKSLFDRPTLLSPLATVELLYCDSGAQARALLLSVIVGEVPPAERSRQFGGAAFWRGSVICRADARLSKYKGRTIA